LGGARDYFNGEAGGQGFDTPGSLQILRGIGSG
jgi:hypothetical protein